MIDASLINQVTKLSVAERLEFMEAIWQSFDLAETPVSDQEKRMLDSRLSDVEARPEDQASWVDVRRRLTDQLP